MRILILNWRSIKDPMEGGAERATFEFAKRWVKNHKAEVTWLSPSYNNKIKSEIIEGIRFEYIGLPLSRNILWLLVSFPYFYIAVIFRYFKKFRGNIDVVIDQVHGIPYLTPLYVKEKVVVYIHEVAGEIWKIMYPFPINYFGIFAEKLIFWIYKIKNIKFIANSESTSSDLKNDFSILNRNIQIVECGVTAPEIEFNDLPKKEKELTIIYLNRIVRMKGIERCIETFSKVLNINKNATLWVVGRGDPEYIKSIKQKCKELDILSSVKFYGFISDQEKFNLLGRSHVLINSSYSEGWGLVNIEANRMGTPAACFKVRGCVDSINQGINGLLAEDGDIEAMVNNILTLFREKKYVNSSYEYSKKYNWDQQSNLFLASLLK